MRVTTILAGLTGLALGAATPLQPRDEWQPTVDMLRCLYMTTELNWSGEGLRRCTEIGKCDWHLPENFALQVSSAGADRNATCVLFSKEQCYGDQSVPIMHGGYGDLGAVGFDNKAVSFICYDNTGVRDSECSAIDEA